MESERLILRRFEKSDWKDLHDYLSLHEVVAYEPYEVKDEEACKEEALYRAGEDSYWAVCLKTSGKMIGNIYFSQKFDQKIDTWALGYVFNPEYGKKGYATEACSRILEYGFKEKSAHRIFARCDTENLDSWRLMERLQMRREGHFKKVNYFKLNDAGAPKWVDVYEYSILSEEYIRL